MDKKSILIVGAGQAGLGAAAYLRDKGVSYILLEADEYNEDKGYGRAKSTTIRTNNGTLVSDNGPEFIGSGFGYGLLYKEVSSLGIKLSRAHNKAWLSPTHSIVDGFKISGRTMPLDIFKASIKKRALLGTNPFKLFAGLIGFLLVARKYKKLYFAADWARLADLDNQSLGDYLISAFNENLTKRVADTVIKGTWGYSAFDVSAVSIILYIMGMGNLYYYEPGIGALQGEMARKLGAKFGNRVEKIICESKGILVRTRNEEYLVEGVVYAAAVDKDFLNKSIIDCSHFEKEYIQNIQWIPRGNVVISASKTSIISDLIKNGVDYLQFTDNYDIQAVTIVGQDDNKHYLSVVIKNKLLQKLMQGNLDRELFDASLKEVLGELGEYQIIDTNFFKNGLPLTPPGTIARLNSYYEEWHKDKTRKIIFAGDSFSFACASLGKAYESGQRAAAKLVEKLEL